MKIDTHQHYWHYQARDYDWIADDMPVLQRDCLPSDSAALMREAGVNAAVAVQARSCAEETDALLAMAQQTPQIVGVVGWTDLRSPQLMQQLARWDGQSLLRGFRHVLQDEPVLAAVLDDPAFSAGVDALQQRQLCYDLLVYGHQMAALPQWCARHDQHWLVLDHVGKPDMAHWTRPHPQLQQWSESLHALAAMPHVVCKLSGLLTERDWRRQPQPTAADRSDLLACFDRALDVFGPARLMFGSDWPVCQLAAPYAVVADMAAHWAATRLSTHEQAAFWWRNAARIYGLQLAPVI